MRVLGEALNTRLRQETDLSEKCLGHVGQSAAVSWCRKARGPRADRRCIRLRCVGFITGVYTQLGPVLQGRPRGVTGPPREVLRPGMWVPDFLLTKHPRHIK